MNKNCCTKDTRNQLLNDFVREVNDQVSKGKNNYSIEKNYCHEYEQMVYMTFSANILFKGLVYATNLYTHIVKIEYAHICNEIIRDNPKKALMEIQLNKVKKQYQKLISSSPCANEWKGLDTFYTLTGGNKKKYKAKRKAINRIYQLITERYEKNIFRLFNNSLKNCIDKARSRKNYMVWLVKNYTWN